jgi:kanamycin kinase
VPPVVDRIAAGGTVHAVWVNDDGGVTYRVRPEGNARGTEFVKVARARDGAGFAEEARRLRWAAPHVAVPQVMGVGLAASPESPASPAAGWAWLHTKALPGLSAVHPRWLAAPDAAVRAIGAGLRMLHERLPVAACPFDWSVTTRVSGLSPTARARLGEAPPVDRLVVCHGDACAPNTLIDDNGRCCGHVDFDDLGVADRWADLAVATLSLGWNYPGRDWEPEFFEAYGVEPDRPRIAYYRKLWQAPDIESD